MAKGLSSDCDESDDGDGDGNAESLDPAVLETALAVKFTETIQEARGRDPERPAGLENLEHLPQRFTVLDADAVAVQDFIERNCRG